MSSLPHNDLEASWPLTGTEPGYYPGAAPTQMPAANLTPTTANPLARNVHLASPAQPVEKAMTPALRLAFLAIVLVLAIPLTAIAFYNAGLIGAIVAWAGIVAVSAIFAITSGHSK